MFGISTKYLIILLAVIVIGCGSGGAGGDQAQNTNAGPAQSPAGIWKGSFTSNVQNKTYNIFGIVSESNLIRFINLGTFAQYGGNINVSGNSFSSTLRAYAPIGSTTFLDGSQVGNVVINGTISEKSSMSGTYSGVGDSGSFALSYNQSLYERTSSLPLVTGTWETTISGYNSTNTITIDSNGKIQGNSTSGCTYSGNINLINSAYNTYAVNLTIGNCGSENGIYNGLASLSDTTFPSDTLIVGISNTNFSFAAALSKKIWSISSLAQNASMFNPHSIIAIDSSNNVHIIYTNSGGNTSYLTNSSGAWLSSSIANGSCGAMILDSNSKIHIACAGVYITNSSGSWTTDTIDGFSSETSIAVDSKGKVHIVYRSVTSDVQYYYQYAVKYATNVSGTWEYTSIYSNRGIFPAIAIDSNDKVHIIYWDSQANLVYATNTSGSWTNITIDSLSSFSYVSAASAPSIAIDSRNNIHIAYGGKYLTNASGSWQKTDLGASDYNCSIALDSNDKVHLISGYIYKTNAYGSWITSILHNGWYNNVYYNNVFTSIAIDSNDKVHIIGSSSNTLVYMTNQ